MKVSVIVHLNSKKPKIKKDLLGILHIYVNKPPIEGKANLAAIKTLADYFKTSKSQIRLLRGERSKQKVFEIGL